MLITSITIDNFRSINRQSIALDRLNVFVGNNDEGKSNILRSLDFFFNREAEIGGANFDRDFCYFANVPQKKAKEIRIKLTIRAPESYSGGQEVVWEKVWRRDGLNRQTMSLLDGQNFGPRSRIPRLLRSARFDYVPAIKGNDYFAYLLGDLYEMLAETVEDEIRDASSSFTKAINKNTEAVLSQISDRLKIDSSLELPTNLRDLFSRLEFKSRDKGLPVALSQRGDGIKVRHVPILLDFFARQANRNRGKGSVPIFTVWGYEEPENNLELSKAVQLAKDFQRYAADVQILLTTHSPAFYSTSEETGSGKLYLVRNVIGEGTVAIPLKSASLPEIDEHMGLLPFVAPYLSKALEERERLQKHLRELKNESLPTLFLEGLTDKRVFEKAWKLFAPSHDGKIRIKSEASAGVNWVKDMLIAWAHGRNEEKALGFLDYDEDGKATKREINDHPKIGAAKLVRAKTLTPPEHIRAILMKGIKIPVRLEEMFPISCWKHAKEKNWLSLRASVIQENGFSDPDRTFRDFCLERGLDEDELLYVLWEIPNEHKDDFSKYACSLGDDVLDGFRVIVDEVGKYFALPSEPTKGIEEESK